MVERLLHTIISAGLAYFTADARRLEEYLTRELHLGAEEAGHIRTYFELDPETSDQAGGPPHIIHSFPRASGPFPCYAIILVSDSIKQKYLGDDLGEGDDEATLDEDDQTDLDGDEGVAIGHAIDYRYDLNTYVFDLPVVCVAYYHLLRHIILGNIPAFHAAGLQNVEFTGNDLLPDPRYMPDNLWIRRLGISFEGDIMGWEARAKGKSIGRAFIGDGITVSGT